MRLGTITRVWKRVSEIKGLEDFTKYEVSNLGEVRSLYYKHQFESKILKPGVDKDGYLYVRLYANDKHKDIRVHQLVALAFIPNPLNLDTVDHIDSIRTNNNVINLQWLSREDNTAKAKSKKVYCVELNQIFPSTREVGRQLGFDQSYISACCNGKYDTAYGLHWKYIE